MFLRKIKLTNFRNYNSTNHEFNSRVTILLGNNAQGKSNFLEALYFLSTTKSPRADRDEELIKYGEEVLRVEGEVEVSHSESFLANLEIAMQLSDGRAKKHIKLNGISKRVSDYCGNLAIVLFSPEDINLVTGSPSLRRSHIDHVLFQVDRQYKRAVSSYEDVLVRKNKVLKAIRENIASFDQLVFWTDQQLEMGKIITEKRREFFNFINGLDKQFGNFNFEYLESTLSRERLLEYQSKEVDAAMSLIGPHRDDFVFNLDGYDLSKYGSRGEQRTAVLDLKIAETSFIEEKLGQRPILLLDDIFSELDMRHKKHVVEISKLQQTIIASVELDSFLKTQYKTAKVARVESGHILN